MINIIRRAGLALAAAMIGGVGLAVVAEPAGATAMQSPTVTWESKCSGVGKVTVTFTAPSGATQTDSVGVGVIPTVGGTSLGGGVLPTASGARTLTVEVSNAGELKAVWGNPGSSNFSPVNANATYKWAAPDKCKPAVDVIRPTCADPYLSVIISNPAGAEPISVTVGGSPNRVPGGENDGLLRSSNTITWSWSAPALGLNGSGTAEYQPPTGCGPDTPGAKPVPPAAGSHQHGHGRYQHTIPVANNGGGTTAPAAPLATEGEQLAVTGSRSGSTATVGLALFIGGALLAGAGVLYMRRRRVRFTAR